jgi:hypothetical protein
VIARINDKLKISAFFLEYKGFRCSGKKHQKFLGTHRSAARIEAAKYFWGPNSAPDPLSLYLSTFETHSKTTLWRVGGILPCVLMDYLFTGCPKDGNFAILAKKLQFLLDIFSEKRKF